MYQVHGFWIFSAIRTQWHIFNDGRCGPCENAFCRISLDCTTRKVEMTRQIPGKTGRERSFLHLSLCFLLLMVPRRQS